jgi:predicted acylesterase/phospholipase RssA
MKPGKLNGIRVCLSASIPDDATDEQRSGIRSFVQSLARIVFRDGGVLMHGSHPTIVPLLEELANGNPEVSLRDRLTLVRAASYCTAKHAEQIAAHEQFARVQQIPNGDPGQPRNTSAMHPVTAQLIDMRDWMADRSDVVVCLGGKWWNHDRERSGIPRELEAFLAQGKPAFAITAFGGAMLGYAEEEPGLLGRLRNGMDARANERLNDRLRVAVDIPQVAEEIAKQIALLPIGQPRIHVRPVSEAGMGVVAPASVTTTAAADAGQTLVRDSFRILCLDGGGIRGVYTAAILATWHRMLGAEAKTNFIQHFDLVAGTSTGSILAVGLAMGLGPQELLDLYRVHGPKIFPDGWSKGFFSRKYSSEPLHDALKESKLSGRKLGEALRPLVIPTIEGTRGEAVILTTPHAADRTAYRDVSAMDAIMASAAAPTFFDAKEITTPIAVNSYVDGGLWANNPILPAVAEATRYLHAPLDRIDVLSLGTMQTELDLGDKLGGGKVSWGWDGGIVSLFFNAQETAAGQLAMRLLQPTKFLRINDFTSNLPQLDKANHIEKLAARGETAGRESFEAVRGRFLDGSVAPAWQKH